MLLLKLIIINHYLNKFMYNFRIFRIFYLFKLIFHELINSGPNLLNLYLFHLKYYRILFYQLFLYIINFINLKMNKDILIFNVLI